MVFEQLFKEKWIERKEHSFFLGFFFTFIGFFSAILIFPADAGIMSVAFTSILLIPSLATLLRIEENVEIREKKLSFRQLVLDHMDIFKVYLFSFFGIFLAYAILILILPQITVINFFDSQLVTGGITGYATNFGNLSSILLNNLLVFVVCFILSLVYGAGSILFITWNASVWGVVFAFFAKEASMTKGANVFIEFISLVSPTLPHMITEALAYISAAIVGGIVSKAVLREKLFSKKFHHIITDAFIFLVLGFILVIFAAIIEVLVFS